MQIQFCADLSEREAKKAMLMLAAAIPTSERVFGAIVCSLILIGIWSAFAFWMVPELPHWTFHIGYLVILAALNAGIFFGDVRRLLLHKKGNAIMYDSSGNVNFGSAIITFGEETDFILSDDGISVCSSSDDVFYFWDQFSDRGAREGSEFFVLAADQAHVQDDGTSGFSLSTPVIVIPKRCLSEEAQDEFGSFLLEIGTLKLPRPPRQRRHS